MINRLGSSTVCEPGTTSGSAAPGASASAGGLRLPTKPVEFGSALYGPCSDGAVCLEIQSWPECRRNLASYSTGTIDQELNPISYTNVSGLPEASFDGGARIELYAGTTTVVVFADPPSLARAAADAVASQLAPAGPAVAAMRVKEATDPALGCAGQLSGSTIAVPASTVAPGNTFTRSSSTCATNHAIDPLNVVWSGSAATVAGELKNWLGWSTDDNNVPPLADHQFASATTPPCGQEHRQRASSCPVCDRNHVRLFDVTVATKPYTVGDAHFDEDVFFGGCSIGPIPARHISSSFTAPRDLIAKQWHITSPAPHLAYWGNTRRLRQCDGSLPMNDGYVLEAGS